MELQKDEPQKKEESTEEGGLFWFFFYLFLIIFFVGNKSSGLLTLVFVLGFFHLVASILQGKAGPLFKQCVPLLLSIVTFPGKVILFIGEAIANMFERS